MSKYFFVLLFILFPIVSFAQISASATIPEISNQTITNQTAVVSEVVNNDPNSWNFGKVKAGDVVEHQFTLKNEGKEPLNILTWSTSCGCTLSDVPKRNLQPGESTPVNVKFNSARYSGEVQQFIYVNTDDKVNSVVKYKVSATVTK